MYSRRARVLTLAVLVSPWMTGCATGGGGSETVPDPASRTPPPTAQSWPIYTNERFGYSFRYPPGFVVREDDADAAIKPTDVIHRVRVEDNPSEPPEAAVPQPAVFTLEVLRKEEGMPLGEWLRSVSRSDGDRISEARVAGTSGYLVELDRYIAPGRFYYIASGQRVYRLTPLGEASEDVLASFVLTG